MNCNDITQESLNQILEIFEKKSYEAGSCEDGTNEQIVAKECEKLFKLDYSLIELDNLNGSLSTRYPSRIFIPECENQHNSNNGFNGFTIAQSLRSQNVIYEDLYDTVKIRELITMAKYARCRQRFIVPVIMYKGKYVCRSATISVMPETYGRKVVDYAYDCINGKNNIVSMDDDINDGNDNNDSNNDPVAYESIETTIIQSPFSYDEVIKSDIQLMKTLNVQTIVDLMVEQRKIKYFVTVSSSEKADPENHYESFNIVSLPYPGCEFFKKFRDNNYMAKNLQFNWKQSFIDASIHVPKAGPAYDIDLNWSDYRKWDLVLITQNYLKAILKYIQEENSGLLIHCISGWDRTPLFISLVRLSLWADGLIHQSLGPIQIAYLTLAYDWYLFGHQLPDRLKCGEDILFFCFHFLKHITDDDFSILEQRKRTKTTSSSGSSSVIILKSDFCDDDSMKDDGILIQNIDQDSNDSFANFEMSMANENIFGNNITNRSPNAKRSKTSPISVPDANSRQRQESTSSNGSWQVVTDTGSIDSMMNGSYMMRFIQQDQQSNGSINKETKSISSLRKQRLNAVRSCFIQAYGKTIGLKFKEGSSMTLATFIGTIADQLF